MQRKRFLLLATAMAVVLLLAWLDLVSNASPAVAADRPLGKGQAQIVAGQKPAAPDAVAIAGGANDQLQPALAYNPFADEYLAVWEYEFSSTDHDIYFRPVAADGAPLGSPTVAAVTAQFESSPAVAYNEPAGEYLIVWEYEFSSTDHDIYALRVFSNGVAAGGVFPITTATADEQLPDVAANPGTGDYLVVWQSDSGSDVDIVARRIGPDGTPAPTAFTVSGEPWAETVPSVAANGLTGEFLVVWELFNPENLSFDVNGNLRAANDSDLTGPIPIASDPIGELEPDVAYQPATDEYFVTWRSENDLVPIAQYGIGGQRLNAAGGLEGGALDVAGPGNQPRWAPTVATNPLAAEYLVAWQHEFSGSDQDVYRRRYTGDGTALEGEVPVSQLVSNERVPDAVGGGSSFLLAWEDERNLGADGVDVYGEALTVVSDLSLLAVYAQPNPVHVGQTVALSAVISNTGQIAYQNVPVAFFGPTGTLGVEVLPEIVPGGLVQVGIQQVFTEFASLVITATVNPTFSLPELDFGNNSQTTTLDVVFEVDPPWSRPDLALSPVTMTPHRPGDGTDVVVSATLENVSVFGASEVELALFVDDLLVGEAMLGEIAPLATMPVSLTWYSATPGRHPLRLIVDPNEQIDERDEDNNAADEWIRVAGAPTPLPDIEVETIDLDPPQPNATDQISISLNISNEGYEDAFNLPVAVQIDGFEISRTVISLNQGEDMVVQVPWTEIGPGVHQVAVVVDPDDVVNDDSLQGVWAQGITVPGTEYALVNPAGLSGQWTLVGPETIDNAAYVGRVDAIDVSSQYTDRMVVAASLGGVWTTDNGGDSWEPLGDHLPSPNFRVTRFDPNDDDIIYAGTGSSLYGEGTGLYKTTDGGNNWTVFADTSLGKGYAEVLLTYNSPNTVTIFAATDKGVFVWEGDPQAGTTKPAQWKEVWKQPVAGKDGRITSLLMTSENPPQLYWAVSGDGVYRVDGSNPLSGTVEHLTGGFPPSTGVTVLGHSPADPDRVYASVRVTGSGVVIYRREHGGNWQVRGGVPSKCAAINPFVGVHPADAQTLYVGAVKGCRSLDGGLEFLSFIPFVHDDFKAMTFDPVDSDIAYFTSDGGVYRCRNIRTVMQCAGLNNMLATTQPYDIALSATNPERIAAGTQDNGTILTDGSLEWRMLRFGDGRYTVIDPTDPDRIFFQHQHIFEVYSTTTAMNGDFDDANGGLPKVNRKDAFMTMDPDDPSTLLIAGDQVYRTTNGGGLWQGIGPSGIGGVGRILIDEVNDRYYATSRTGEIWTVAAAQAGPSNWSRIYQPSPLRWIATLSLDPGNRNVLFAAHMGGGKGRVVRLQRTAGWDDPWSWEAIADNLDGNRTLNNNFGTVRGLLKDPDEDVIYLATDRGVYQGRLPAGASKWQWFPDSCGLPLTHVSDMEFHPSGAYMAAGTFGRSVYTRTLAQFNPAPDVYESPQRNDAFSVAYTLPVTLGEAILLPSYQVQNVNLDSNYDKDFFSVQLPPMAEAICLSAGDPLLQEPGYEQCQFKIVVRAPQTPDPFTITLYKADGSVFREATPTQQSNLSYVLERPYDAFPDGKITFSIRNATGCRSQYDLDLYYHNRYGPPLNFPPLDYDIEWYLPDVANFSWHYPADPDLINSGFLGALPATPPRQQAAFDWSEAGAYSAIFDVAGFGDLAVNLLDAQGNVVASATPLGSAEATTAGSLELSVPDLPAGAYALDFGDGVFPTFFSADVSACRADTPQVLQGTVAGNTVSLAWTGSGGSEAHEIHRSPSPYFSPTPGTLVDTVPGAQLSYDDVGVLTGGPDAFYYRVVAVGCGAAQTAVSAELGVVAFALTPGEP